MTSPVPPPSDPTGGLSPVPPAVPPAVQPVATVDPATLPPLAPTGRWHNLEMLFLILSRHWHVTVKDLLLTALITISTVVLLTKLATGDASQGVLMILSGMVGSVFTMLTHGQMGGMNPYGGMGMGGYGSGGMYGGSGYGSGGMSGYSGMGSTPYSPYGTSQPYGSGMGTGGYGSSPTTDPSLSSTYPPVPPTTTLPPASK